MTWYDNSFKITQLFNLHNSNLGFLYYNMEMYRLKKRRRT